MIEFDYQYVNESNEFEVVKFTLDGYFVCVDCEVSDEILTKMDNIDDVEGWRIEHL